MPRYATTEQLYTCYICKLQVSLRDIQWPSTNDIGKCPRCDARLVGRAEFKRLLYKEQEIKEHKQRIKRLNAALSNI